MKTLLPRPKKTAKEIELTKELCLPLGSDFNDYLNLWGTPYYIFAPQRCNFQKGKLLCEVYFVNEEKDLLLSKRKLDKSICWLLYGMRNGISKQVIYQIISQETLNQYSKAITDAREIIVKFSEYTKVDLMQQSKIIIKTSKASDISSYKNLLSLPPGLISDILSCYSDKEWTLLPQSDIGIMQYTAWKNGRKLYATYNIIYKNLKIELGIKPEDYKPEIIKKLREKSQSGALKDF